MPLSVLCFLTLGVLAHSEPQCADGSCEVPGTSKQMDDESTDMRVELLQRDLKLSSRENKLEHEKDGTVEVEEWNCAVGQTAYQSTTAGDNSWTRMKVLNLTTGGYGLVHDVDLNKFADVDDCPTKGSKCKIRSMNACAIHKKPGQKKGILYCAMQIYDKGAFLVAIDQKNNMGFVQKLLGWRYAATFYKDDYYVSGEQGLSIVKNVPSLKKYKSWVELNSAFYGHGTQAGETKVALYMGDENSKNFGLGADFVTWKKNSEKAGTPADDYLMTLKDKELLLIQLSKGGEDISSNEVISLASNVKVGPNGKRCWGAAWNFNGAIFFSADDGYGGLWRFDSADFEAKTATFTNMTAVNKIDWNDGFTCGDSLKIKKDPQPCEHDFYQVVTSMYVDPATDKTVDANGNPTPWSDSPQTKTTSRTYVRHLDKKSGTFTNDFTVDRSKFPSMTSLNACAVHPKSNKLYCMMNTLSYQSIAVVDETGPALVMKHEPAEGGSNLCFAAVFDSNENYWYWCNDKYLYRAQKLDTKTILWSENDDDWSANDVKAFGQEFTDDKVGADFIVWEEGKKNYLISIVESTDNKVSVIDVTTGVPKKPKIFKSSGLESTVKNGQKVTWGSSWTAPLGGENAGKAFFTPDAKPESANEKVDSLFQLEKLDFEAEKAYFVGGGMAAPAQWHDGFTCKTKIARAGKGRQEIDSR